jgi:hypothetical protein
MPSHPLFAKGAERGEGNEPSLRAALFFYSFAASSLKI